MIPHAKLKVFQAFVYNQSVHKLQRIYESRPFELDHRPLNSLHTIKG